MRLPTTLAVIVVASLLPHTAAASPWTLPRGDLAVVTGFNFQSARREYLDDHESQPFPLRGRYAASDVVISGRFGLTDDWELELSLPMREVSYEADPVILIGTEPVSDVQAFNHYQDNTLDFSRVTTGLGDLRVSVRHRLVAQPVPTAVELRLKTPTGYDPPSGTFGDRPKDEEDFVARAGELVRPENISDDVTLGDGQLDLSAQLLLGYATRHGTFTRLDAGYKLRLGGGGDQVIATAKAGQLIAGAVLVYAGGQIAYAVQDGEVIGISVAAKDPRLPATEYGIERGELMPLHNLVFREVTLDYDAAEVNIGVILRVVEGAEINVGYSRTVWGRNTALFNSLYVSVGARLSTLEHP